jgi:uncharacterized protein
MPSLQDAKSWYPQTDPVHGFDHILRVYHMAVKLTLTENADLDIVRAAALLHDAQSSETEGGDEGRLDHHHASAEFARQVLSSEGWPEYLIEAVLHCIRAHRFRDQSEQPRSIEAKILFDADKLDAIGAIGVARALAYSVMEGLPFYAEPSNSFLQNGYTQPGEPHTAYHEHIYKLSKIKTLLYTPAALAIAERRHRLMMAYFSQLAAEFREEEEE